MGRAIVPALAPEPLDVAPCRAPRAWWSELCAGAPVVEYRAARGSLLRAEGSGIWLARAALPAGASAVNDAAFARARCDSWCAAVRAWCVRALELPLDQLLRRRAIVSATRTHIDVVFPVSQIELRIGRRAIDADPGWVPWLGRVIAFHYVEDEDSLRMLG